MNKPQQKVFKLTFGVKAKFPLNFIEMNLRVAMLVIVENVRVVLGMNEQIH
jgi:hypothetical protein